MRLAARLDRRRLVVAGVLMAVGYLATPFIALGLRELFLAAVAGDVTRATSMAFAVAVLLVFELMMAHFAHLYYFEVGELAETALNEELLRHVNGERSMAELDDPEFADGVTMIQEELARTRYALEAVLQMGAFGLQALLTTAILATLNPWLLLLPLAALPPVLVGKRAQALVDAAKEGTAESARRTRHLLELATTPEAIKEIRLFHGEREVLRRQAEGWSGVTAALSRAHHKAAALRAAAQSVFALAYGGAIVLIIWQALRGRANAGDLILVVALAVQVSVQVSSALNLLAMLQGVSKTVERLTALRSRPATPAQVVPTGQPRAASPNGSASLPSRLRRGIHIRRLSFTYPGTDRPVLHDVDLHIPAGSTVAVVGENGAGKSTLVKLICGLYQPTDGQILVDGVDIRHADPPWRARIAPLFQDFAQFELLLRENVGLGDVARIGDDATVHAAVEHAEAGPIVAAVPGGLSGLLGHGYGDGTNLSGGQWQRLGLARALMRPDPLLLVLDEPAAALDAAAEHAIFERYRASADRAGRASGAVTLFVSHRFSTVRLADLIVVLRGGRVVECGSHDALLRHGGLYAELFTMQARAST